MFHRIVRKAVSISMTNASCLLVLRPCTVVLHTRGKIPLPFVFGNDNTDEDMWECIYQINTGYIVDCTQGGKHCCLYRQSLPL